MKNYYDKGLPNDMLGRKGDAEIHASFFVLLPSPVSKGTVKRQIELASYDNK